MVTVGRFAGGGQVDESAHFVDVGVLRFGRRALLGCPVGKVDREGPGAGDVIDEQGGVLTLDFAG